VSTDQLATAKAEFETGKHAFERGNYRQSVTHLELACAALNPDSALGGEVQTWLVTAYEASGQSPEALQLCKQLTRHPDWATRKQAKRLLSILEAPRLKTRPEWLVQIPDLSNLSESGTSIGQRSEVPKERSRQEPETSGYQLEPEDRSQFNTNNDQFVWVAFAIVLLGLSSLLWLSQQ
jgi:tetratricopeptide (TPR) repeat protein